MPASRPRPKNAEPDATPELFAGKYRLIRMLGKGAMGEVWLAEEEGPRNFRRRVALKRLAARPELGDSARESFFAEAQVIARLDHPNVVRLIELGNAGGSVYLALDYIDGPAIDRVLKRVGAFSPRAVAYIGREMARALEAVHTLCEDDGRRYAVVHRDVSPSNILIARDGRVRLTDFGVARIPGLPDEQADGGVFKGKLPYMPPEQARGEPFDGRADVFSLGITLLEALLGSRVRKAETQTQLILRVASTPIPRARELLPDLCAPLADALDAATEFSVARRTESAGKMAEDLERALLGMGQGAEQEARNELKERVEAYLSRTGSASSSGFHVSPSQPPAGGPGQAEGSARRSSRPAPSADRPSGRPSSPEDRRSAPSVRGIGAPRPLVAGSLSVQYLDFDGPDDAPARPRPRGMQATPEDELRRGHAAVEAAGHGVDRSSTPGAASKPPASGRSGAAASRPPASGRPERGASKPPASGRPGGASKPPASGRSGAEPPASGRSGAAASRPPASGRSGAAASRPPASGRSGAAGEPPASGRSGAAGEPPTSGRPVAADEPAAPLAARAGAEGACEEPAQDGLSAELMQRKRRIFYAGLFVLGALATTRLLFVAGC